MGRKKNIKVMESKAISPPWWKPNEQQHMAPEMVTSNTTLTEKKVKDKQVKFNPQENFYPLSLASSPGIALPCRFEIWIFDVTLSYGHEPRTRHRAETFACTTS
jgi:hypothetical protein